MLSTYKLFQDKQRRNLRRVNQSYRPIKGLFNLDLPKTSIINIPVQPMRYLDPLAGLRLSIEEFNKYILGTPEDDQLKTLAKQIVSDLEVCFNLHTDDIAIEASKTASKFIVDLDLEKLSKCVWAQDLQIINDFSIYYLRIAFEPVVESLWKHYLKSVDLNRFAMFVDCAQSIIFATIMYCDTNLKIAKSYIDCFVNSSRVDLTRGLEIKACQTLDIVEKNIELFFKNLGGRHLSESVLQYSFDKILFDSYISRCNLALRRRNVHELQDYLDKCQEIKLRVKGKQMHKTYCHFTNQLAQLKIEISKESRKESLQKPAQTQNKTPRETTTSAAQTMVEVNKLPQSYQESETIRQQVDFFAELMRQAGIYGYINGSFNFKPDPGDIDLVFVNLASPAELAKFKHFYKLLTKNGARLPNEYSSTYGYMKNGLQVITVSWAQANYKSVDLVICQESLPKHAEKIDKTISIIYFCPRRKKMFRMPHLSSLMDLERRRINFHGDVFAKLSHDPDIIFMNIKLHLQQGFSFAGNTWEDIIYFAGQVDYNIFAKIPQTRLFKRLETLLSAPYQSRFLELLQQFNLFEKLHAYLATVQSSKGIYYFNFLNNYAWQIQQAMSIQYVVVPVYVVPVPIYTEGYSCGFYSPQVTKPKDYRSQNSESLDTNSQNSGLDLSTCNL